MEGLGIRPTLFEMGQRLADHGYVVLVPDLFYRARRYDPLDPEAVFASGDVRGALAHLFSTTDNRRAAEDTEAFLDYLNSRRDVAGTKVGTTGYCMGGAISLTAAGTYPDRVADAGIDRGCEVYQGAQHGWTMADFPVYNHVAAGRHWEEMVSLFASTLTQGQRPAGRPGRWAKSPGGGVPSG